MSDVEYYLIEGEEAKEYGSVGNPLHITRKGDKWYGTTAGSFNIPSVDINVVQSNNGGVLWDNVRLHLLRGYIAAFRVNWDGTPFEAPSEVTTAKVDIKCPQCARPNDLGYTKCWWCETPWSGLNALKENKHV